MKTIQLDSIKNDYNYLKGEAQRHFESNNDEAALEIIRHCAGIGYSYFFEERLIDQELEGLLQQISQRLISQIDFAPNPNCVVLLDSYCIENRGLTQQYLKALIDLEYEIVLLVTTDHYFRNAREIINTISNYKHGQYFMLHEKLSRIACAVEIATIIYRVKPSKILFHPSPYDVSAFLALIACNKKIERYLINITDDHFWLGTSTYDYLVEFRNFGWQWSQWKRRIPESKLKLLPFYPITKDKTSFNGLPKETDGKIVAVSGGTGYKFLGLGNKYSELVSKLLLANSNLVLLLVGAGKGGEIVKSLCDPEVKERIILEPSRKDIFQVVAHADIYIASMPRAGALMSQMAIEAEKPILNFVCKGMLTAKIADFSPFGALSKTDIEEEEEFLAVANRLIRDAEFRKEYAALNEGAIITKADFTKGLQQILDGENPFCFLVKHDKSYLENLKLYEELAIEVDEGYLQGYTNSSSRFKVSFKKRFGKDLKITQVKQSLIPEMLATVNKLRKLTRAYLSRHYGSLFATKTTAFNQLNFQSLSEDCRGPKEFMVVNPQYMRIGKHFRSLRGLRLEAIDKRGSQRFFPEIKIGDNFSCGTDVHIGAIGKIHIGNNVLFASRIYVSDHSHGEINKEELLTPPNGRPLYSKGPISIENNVWVGAGVAILPNVTVGHNSIIGANAVVTKSFPSFSIIAGNPAKLIKSFNDD